MTDEIFYQLCTQFASVTNNRLFEISLPTEEFKMEEKLIQTIELNNGLILKIFDISRKIAGDRWYVGIHSTVDISLSSLEGKPLPISLDTLRNALGDTICYLQKRERNFIDEKKKDEVLKELATSFTKSIIPYVSHPDFPKRFVLKQYREYLEKKKIEEAYKTLEQ